MPAKGTAPPTICKLALITFGVEPTLGSMLLSSGDILSEHLNYFDSWFQWKSRLPGWFTRCCSKRNENARRAVRLMPPLHPEIPATTSFSSTICQSICIFRWRFSFRIGPVT
jgi:hypothetical protein